MTRKCPADSDLLAAAQDYVHRWFPDGDRRAGRLVRPHVDLDEGFCRAVAGHFDQAPELAWDPQLGLLYDRLKNENLQQYGAIRAAGLRVRPWLEPAQPYRDSHDLREKVLNSGTLYVYLTRSGHGPDRAQGFHPMREPSGIEVDGVQLSHNDVFRAVHDVFGHVVASNGFGPRGEFAATYCHLHLYPGELLPVLFTEQIGQICWFFFGPHLAGRSGRLPVPGDPGYLPPARRPYPKQKVFRYPPEFLEEFQRMFSTLGSQGRPR